MTPTPGKVVPWGCTDRTADITHVSCSFSHGGRNWYGCETEQYSLQGLDVRKLEDVFQFLKQRKFNALRIPFSLKFAKDPENIINQYFQDDTLRGLTRFGFMDKIIETAASHDMLVMLDLHRSVPKAFLKGGRGGRTSNRLGAGQDKEVLPPSDQEVLLPSLVPSHKGERNFQLAGLAAGQGGPPSLPPTGGPPPLVPSHWHLTPIPFCPTWLVQVE